MQGKYILLASFVLIALILPVGASTNKIVAGAPVFIGETNLDISRALDNCRIIAWWPAGADTGRPAAKNITLRPLNEVSDVVNHYAITPAEYGDYTGTWYCEEKKPLKAVFVITKPNITIRFWDLDTNKDVSGTTVLSTTNITYRIDTNLDSALQWQYRPDVTPADSIFTVKLTDPLGRSLPNIYTGSSGASGAVILPLDAAPHISSSPYIWTGGSSWNRASRNAQGEEVYPMGTYVFTANQNLDGIPASYKAANITNTDGLVSSSARITFVKPAMVTSAATSVLTRATTGPATSPGESLPATTLPVAAQDTPLSTTPVPVKTTYAPLPGCIAFLSLVIAGALPVWPKR